MSEAPGSAPKGKSASLKAVRGTRDLLPPETALWNRVEAVARSVFSRYGFGEIRTPVFEDTSLFARGVGEETDIVSKEMYTWLDGERLNEGKLIDAWLFDNNADIAVLAREIKVPGTRGPHIDLLVRRKSTNLFEVLEFKPTATASGIEQLRHNVEVLRASDPATFRDEVIVMRLVVPSGKKSLVPFLHPVGENPVVVIEEIGAIGLYDTSHSLTLRPENTAGVVRAYIEHKLGDTGNLQKLFYIGPQFRRERPQRGRYRQFWQIGAEVIGAPTSGAESSIRDAEVLEMIASLLDELGITGWTLYINSLGSSADRARYVSALREKLPEIKHLLSPESQLRAEANPLRILDSKDPRDQELVFALPKIADFLDEASTAHFQQVRAALDACGVPYTVNPRLVRGLDYYTRTTFEFSHSVGLGSQNALLGGGRYDGLSEMLGGPRAPGIGFAIGEDRLILTLQAQAEAAGTPATPTRLDAYIAPLTPAQNPAALLLARELRRAGLSIALGDGTFRLKKSFEAADAVARTIILLGEDEVATGVLTLKTFATGQQIKIERDRLTEFLRAESVQ